MHAPASFVYLQDHPTIPKQLLLLYIFTLHAFISIPQNHLLIAVLNKLLLYTKELTIKFTIRFFIQQTEQVLDNENNGETYC